MTIATFPQTSLGSAAAAVVEQLSPPQGVSRVPCPDDATWRALRSKDITASVAAALLNAHAWETPFGLFAAKSGMIEADSEETAPMKRGRLLEPVAIELLREDQPDWTVIHNAGQNRVYYRDPQARIGATPDALVTDPTRGLGAVQIKSVEASVFRRKWMVDNTGDGPEPPVWIAVQAIIEATLIGAQWAAVAPLVVGHGVDMPLIEVPLHAGVMTRVRAAVKDFWRRVAENDPYPPDFARDGALIANLFADDDGGEIDLSGNARIVEIMCARDELKKREADGADAAKQRKVYDAEIIHLLGNAARGRLADGRLIEAKTIRRAGYTVQPSQYRAVKVKEARA
ncbi:YqaJ viral recombinase family protein [Methylocystis rosea]|uniref:YqaJ viral recombinase family protein n=1 Tax=Methylocystis rosea TaxID=173366 RepID=UPI00036DBE3F|nr:YqaJ viral recombinase family protein [Methylocystis rosea]